ncbi:MAG: hypothetical protein ACYTBZ_16320 [Planctomycetota bacterium]|jgi:hypothetical protein
MKTRLFFKIGGVMFLVVSVMAVVCEGVDVPVLDYLSLSSYGRLLPIQPAGYFAVGTRYIHPPVAEWKNRSDVDSYELILVQGEEILGVTRAKVSPKKVAKGWSKVRPGKAGIVIQGFDVEGKRIGMSRMLPFYVAPDFDKSKCPKALRSYKEAAIKCFDALYNFKLPASTPAPAEGPGSKIHEVLLSCAGNVNGFHPHSFPALHDWQHVEMLVSLNKIADRELKEKIIKYAHSVGGHLLMCRLPADYEYGGMVRGCADYNGQGAIGVRRLRGTVLGEKMKRVVEPGKCSYVAEALVQLYELTKDKRYLAAAVRMAELLVRHQGDDGSWPARVDGKTGGVLGDYSTTAIGVASFMDCLHDHVPDKRWLTTRDKALEWVLQNPVKTYAWVVNYDDGVASANRSNLYQGISNWDLCAFVGYVSEHKVIIPRAAELIKDQLEWNDNHFIFYGSDPLLSFEPYYPCCAEQGNPRSHPSGCWTPMDFHTANWARALIAVYVAMQEVEYLEKALAAANVLTRYQLDDGRTMTWMCDKTTGLSVHHFGLPNKHNFWPAAWAMSASVWAELAYMGHSGVD